MQPALHPLAAETRLPAVRSLSSRNWKGRLCQGVSGAALALACLQTPAAQAKTYTAGTLTEFNTVLAAANADGDPSSTIVLTGGFSVGGIPAAFASKPIRIDTQGFTLTGLTFQGNSWELFGNITGGNATLNLTINSGGHLTNYGTITGFPTRGGATVSSGGTLVNNGTITGGANGVVGATISTGGGTIINNSLIQGGAALAAAGGGVLLQLPSGTSTLINNSTGTIRGATSADGTVGGQGIRQVGSRGTITNFGLVEGGLGATAITITGNSGATIINAGTLRAGSGGADAVQFNTGAPAVNSLELQAGSQLFGNVVASTVGTNDTLRLGGDSNWTLDGGIGSTSQYQNFEALDKTGASTWTVTGSGDFAGATNVLAGRLVVNGSLAGSAVTVQSGGTLAGSGTVGATTLASGSRITPGNSIGTLTVNGAYVQNAGAVYEVEIDPRTATSDRIDAKGTATLASGAAISVINFTNAAFVAGQRYTILTSAGLTGSYGGADLALTPFLSLRNGTDATNAYLSVVQTATAGAIGGTPNEVAVGASVDSLPVGNALQTDLYNQATLEAARGALGQLAGEIHASARTVLLDESSLLRAAANDRLRSAFGTVGSAPMATLAYGFTADLAPAVKGPMPKPPSAERFAVWGQGYGSWGRINGDGNAASLSRTAGGLLVGADAAAFESLRLGVVAGYSRSTFQVNGRLSSGESDNYHLGLYGGGQWGALGLRTGASYTWHDLSTRRSIVSAGLADTLRANYDAGTAQVFGELGYRIDLGPVAFEPFAGLAYVNLHSDRFSEIGGVAALSGSSDDTSLGYTTLGLRAAASARLQGMDLTLRGGLGWSHAFGDVDPKTALAFAGSIPFTIAGLPIARNAAIVEAGLDLGIGRGATLGVAYNGQLAEDAQDHTFKGVLAVRF
jgi:outer membrane autotransporter protein